jgi:hypothetical protein
MRSPLAAALSYADRGWAVFPCNEPVASGCSCHRPGCASPAKHPRTIHGLRDASTDPERIARWWRRWPTANIGVQTGATSGLVVLDVDPDHEGLRTLADLQRQHGPLPPSPAVRTGGGGRHYWFAHPGQAVRNSAGRLGSGLDIRGDGGYVIAPPSRHITGGRYVWASEVALAPPPRWLLELAREPAPPEPAPERLARHPVRGAGAWAQAALRGELGRVREASEGTRNNTLNRAAFVLGQLVATGHLAEQHVGDVLISAGLSAGLRPSEVRATVASGLKAGMRIPRARLPAQPVPRIGRELE